MKPSVTTLIRWQGTALLAAIALVPDAGARHEKCLPVETYAVVRQTDLDAYKKRLETHPLAADLKKAGFDEYFAPMAKAFEEGFVKQGHDAKEFVPLLEFLPNNLNGEILYAIVKTPKPVKGHMPFDFIVFADMAADEKTIVELLEKYFQTGKPKHSDIPHFHYKSLKAEMEGTPIQEFDEEEDSTQTFPQVSQWGTVPFQGVTLHEYTVKTGDLAPVSFGGWALAGKTLVIATSPNALRESIDALQNGRKDNFAGTVAWQRTQSSAGNADIIVTANTPFLAEELRNFIATKAKDGSANMGVDVLKAYDTLRLENISAFWMALELTPADVRLRSGLAYTEKSGLLSMLTYKPLEPLVPAFIPAGKSFDTINWDMTQAWQNFETLFAQALPTMKPFVDMWLAKLKTEEGVDLRDEFLGNFGKNITVIQGTRKPGKDVKKEPFSMPNHAALIVMDVRDPAKLASLFETALGKIGKGGTEAILDEINYMGVEIRSLKKSFMGDNADELPEFAYAIHDGKFFLAMDATDDLKKTIAEIKTPQNPAAKTAVILQAAKYALKDAVSFSYIDVAEMTGIYLDMIEPSMEASKLTPPLVDKTKRPDMNAIPWVLVSTSQERTNEVYCEAVIFRKEEK